MTNREVPRIRPVAASNPAREWRRPALTALVLALGAVVAFTLGQLSTEAVDLPHSHARTLLIIICAISASALFALLLGVFIHRQHNETRSALRQLSELVEQSRLTGYEEGYLDGVQRRQPAYGRSTTLRPVN